MGIICDIKGIETLFLIDIWIFNYKAVAQKYATPRGQSALVGSELEYVDGEAFLSHWPLKFWILIKPIDIYIWF